MKTVNDATWDFVRRHQNDDVRKVALQGTKGEEIDLPFALQQIAGWQTAKKKLPSWAAVEGIVYPPHLNMEQCSSEQTARYKTSLSQKEKGTFVDLTGGYGVDFYWMSKDFQQRVYVEQNEELCTIVEGNLRLLGCNASVYNATASDFLSTMEHVDIIYLDPARRNEYGGRTYGIGDCTPNVLELLPILMEKTDRVILKLSPMLDWRKAMHDLKYVREVHIVSVNNECKELLLVLEERNDALNDCSLHCINLLPDHTVQRFDVPCTDFPSLSNTPSGFSSSQDTPGFLYEPNASIMKAGCFAELEQRYAVHQLASNSHLFLSFDEIDDFPGRKFQIAAISSANRKEFSKTLVNFSPPLKSANIAVRNFPLTAEQLRKKMKLKDGGSTYIFATTMANGLHQLFFCRKIG